MGKKTLQTNACWGHRHFKVIESQKRGKGRYDVMKTTKNKVKKHKYTWKNLSVVNMY